MKNIYENYISGFNALVDGQQEILKQSFEIGKTAQSALISGELTSVADLQALQAQLIEQYTAVGNTARETTKGFFNTEERLQSLSDAQRQVSERLITYGKTTGKLWKNFFEDSVASTKISLNQIIETPAVVPPAVKAAKTSDSP